MQPLPYRPETASPLWSFDDLVNSNDGLSDYVKHKETDQDTHYP